MNRSYLHLLFAVLTAILLPVAHADESNTVPGTFKPAPGLKVEVFAAEPLLMNPVAFSIDEKGRVFVSETHRYREAIFDITKNPSWLLEDLAIRTVAEREALLARNFTTNFNILTNKSELIRLVEDRDGDGKAETSTIYATGFQESVSGTAAGILARENNVWFTCIPDLWRLLDSNRDGTSDHREKLQTGFGPRISVSGHDLHGLVMGPDGRIYFSIGDRAFDPPDDIKGYGFTTEYLRKILHETGAVFRCNPDGSNFEVFAIGLRNPQELAFDQFGNLWTDDNDTAGKDDSRVIHVVQGGDYGWRVSYQHGKNFGPWVEENVWQGNIDDVLPLAGVVAQGPSGLAYNPGPYLGTNYHHRFFVCDFPGGVWSFNVKPKGASYVVDQKEKFLWGLWPTDVDFANDGTVMVADWTPGWNPSDKGRLYRISDTAAPLTEANKDVAKLIGSEFSEKKIAELISLLAHPDYRVRLNAQFALSTKEAVAKIGGTKEVYHLDSYNLIMQGQNQLARIHALWSLTMPYYRAEQLGLGSAAVNAGSPNLIQCIPIPANNLPADLLNACLDPDPEIRAQVALAMGERQVTRAKEVLRQLLKDSNPRVQFFAAQSLGKLKDKDGILALSQALAANTNNDAYITHAVVAALVNIGDVTALRPLMKSSDVKVRRGALLALRRLEDKSIQEFLSDPDPRLVIEAARAINDVPITNGFPALANKLIYLSHNTADNSGLTNALLQLGKRSINAHFRLGNANNARALALFLQNTNAPEALKVEALNALGDWGNPSTLDRVIGLWRPLRERSPVPAALSLKQVSATLWASTSESLLVASAEAVAKLKLKDTSPALLAIFLNAKLALPARIAALNALDSLQATELAQAVQAALQEQNLAVKREGVRLIARADVPDAATLLEKIVETEKDIRLGQAAYTAMGYQKGKAITEALARQMNKLLTNEVKAELRLDLLEAARKQKAEAIQNLLKQYDAKLDAKDALASYREALVGGDATNGRKLVAERADVECLRCHQVNGVGGIVGPNLNGVGQRLTKEKLLESIVFPNRQIALGFENATLVRKNGTSVAGLIKAETPDSITLESAEDGLVTLQKTEIERRIANLSAMPEGLAERFTKHEIRDVVEYLFSLKK
jgi:quinoprotein glucose dehydrogenase